VTGKLLCFFVMAAVWRARYRSVRMAGSVCILIAGFATLLVLAGGVFVVRLKQSPIIIDGLGPRIAEGLDQKFGRGLHFGLGQTSIIKHGFGPALGIDGLSLTGADGQKIFDAPYAEVTVDPFALVIGRVTPKRLEVSGVEIKLSVLANGSLTVSSATLPDNSGLVVPAPLEAPVASPETELDITATVKPKIPRSIVIKQAAKALRLLIDTLTNPDSSIAAVDHVGVSGGRLVVDDKTTDEQTVFEDLDLAFDKVSGATDFHVSTRGPNGRWNAFLKASGTPGTQRQLDISIDNITLDEISLASGIRNLGVDFDMPVSTQLSVVLMPDGTVASGVGQFNLGAGYFRLDDPDDEPTAIDGVDGRFHWEPATRRIVLDDTLVKAGPSHFEIAGSLTPPVFEGDAFALNLFLPKPGVVGPQRPGEQPIAISSGDFAARMLAKEKRFVIDRLSFSGSNFGFALAGDIDWRAGPHVRIGASINPSPIPVVERLWPSAIAAPVRSWLLGHFKEGTIDSGTLRVDLNEAALKAMRLDQPPPDDASSIDFAISDGTLNFLPGVPPLHDLTGTAHISGHKTKVSITKGVLDTAPGHRLFLSDGSFSVEDARIKPTPAVVSGRVTAPVEAVKELLSYEAFKGYASMPIDSPMHGQVDGRLEVDLKVGAGSESAEPLIVINAVASNLSIEKLIGKEKLDAATLSFNVDGTGMKATGQGRLFGVPATLEMSKPLGATPAEATVSFTTDDASRAKQGFLPIPGISGPIGTRINAVLSSDKPKGQVELDLTKTTFEGALPGLSKAAGVPGKASFSLTAGDDSTQIDQIALDMGAVQIRGSAELGSDQSLVAAKFSQVRLSPGDDMKIDVAKAGDGLKVTVRATTIDARPFLKPFSMPQSPAPVVAGVSDAAQKDSGKESDALKNIDIDVKSGLLTGHNKKTISNFDMHFVKQNNVLKQLSFAGHFGRDALGASMAPETSQFSISSQDAGSLLAFVDLYRHMEDGELAARVQLGSNDNMSGKLEIRDFTLRDEPAMRRLVAAGVEQTLEQDRTHAPQVNADAVRFKRLQVGFQRSGSRLDLRDGTMYGNEFGLTVEGFLDFPHDKVGLNGTFVPAYEVNNLFSKIPVFGMFLGGGTNEGLFAINYNISGSPNVPTLNINPLSAIAPGFLRKIFGAMDTNNQNTPSMPLDR
jgi:hypothetical protein